MLDSGGLPVDEIDVLVERVRADGPVPLPLDVAAVLRDLTGAVGVPVTG